MALPDALVFAAAEALRPYRDVLPDRDVVAEAVLVAFFAWLRADAPEAVEARTRMGAAFWDAWNDRDHPDAADAVAMAAALAELAGDA